MTQEDGDDDISVGAESCDQESSMSEWAGEAAHVALALKTGVPPAVQKSLGKVLGRLVTAVVAYPTGLIENAARERKAESDARVRLIDTSKNQLAAQLKVDPAYAVAASHKYAERIVRSQVNLDLIAAKAVEELSKLPAPAPDVPQEDVPPVDDDWLNVFEAEASQMSSDHAQRIFAKILAGEIKQPSTFSKKTLKLMSQLDNHAAEVFSRACSIAVSQRHGGKIFDARVVGLGDVGNNSLAPYGLSYTECTLLQEYGLVASELGGYSDFQGSIAIGGNISRPFGYQNSEWVLVPKGDVPRAEFRLEGIRFSASGSELLPIVEIQLNDDYTTKFREHLEQRGMTITKLIKQGDGRWQMVS